MTEQNIGGRQCLLLRSGAAAGPVPCLLQPEEASADPAALQREAALTAELARGRPFLLAVFPVEDWNTALSPWPAPPVFGKEAFGDGAEDTLRYVEHILIPGLAESASCFLLGGYSLAGLFSLWAVWERPLFAGAAGVSPSVWFPGWSTYAREGAPQTERIYLSLGDREERTRNRIMASVGDNIRSLAEQLKDTPGLRSLLEWNRGNHFTDPALRMAKGFAWLLDGTDRRGTHEK